MDPHQVAEVWERLLRGRSLDGLGLSTRSGLVDLRGIAAPEPEVQHRYGTVTAEVKELGGLMVFRGVHWKGLDFSGARLGSLRFFDSRIENCSFDDAKCRDWRMWGTTVEDTSFRTADLHGAALGGVENGKRNVFRRVTFAKADMRKTAYKSCDMLQATFDETNLCKVDFQGTVFVDCVFSGELDGVLFYRFAFRGEAFPPNDMKGVDLRRARLTHVEFRGLDMDDVRWPEDDDHVVVEDYVAKLDRALAMLQGRNDVGSRRLGILLGSRRKWAGPNQKRGAFSKKDLVDAAGPDAVTELLAVLVPN